MPAGCPHCGRRLLPVGVHTTVISPPRAASVGGSGDGSASSDDGGEGDDSDGTAEREELCRQVVDLTERTVVVRAVALYQDDPEPVVADWCPDESCAGQQEAREAVSAHLDRLAETYRE
ncbi:hypothetical protein [Haloarchaeobius sp. DT45]|uniref:hypothetical protein n=1 Tax=Haloarchaeobius sp. DT45 TaxID=3446116 RepID=UPI003F6CC58B